MMAPESERAKPPLNANDWKPCQYCIGDLIFRKRGEMLQEGESICGDGRPINSRIRIYTGLHGHTISMCALCGMDLGEAWGPTPAAENSPAQREGEVAHD